MNLRYLSVFLLIWLCLACTGCANAETLQNPVPGGVNDQWTGNRIFLGAYEQDNDASNGPEPILWRVLQTDGETALLLSEYALDVVAYNSITADVTWETCTLRTWLNQSFLQKAFADYPGWDQASLLFTRCVTAPHQRFGTDGGNPTLDRVFLLAWEDTYNEDYGFTGPVYRTSEYTDREEMAYAPMSYSRMCYPTLYTANRYPLLTRSHDIRHDDQGNSFDAFGTGYWVLRTPGKKQRYIANVSRWGRTTYDFDSTVDHTECCIRPAIRIDLTRTEISLSPGGHYYVGDENYGARADAALDYRKEIQNRFEQETETAVLTIQKEHALIANPVTGGTANGQWAGSRLYFGTWEGQDILWRVLKLSSDRLLLLSEFTLTSMAYQSGQETGTSWEASLPRAFLNDTFLKSAFTRSERKAIVTTQLSNGIDPRYGMSSGEDTRDKVFLLTAQDLCNPAYGFTAGDPKYNDGPTHSNSRICYRASAASQLLSSGISCTKKYGMHDAAGRPIYVHTKLAEAYWTRTPGFDSKHEIDCNIFGDAYHHEQKEVKKKLGIRPAIRIRLEDITLVQHAGAAFPYAEIKADQ